MQSQGEGAAVQSVYSMYSIHIYIYIYVDVEKGGGGDTFPISFPIDISWKESSLYSVRDIVYFM